MGFWIFMMIMMLLIPVTMIGFGRSFMKGAPKYINGIYGYRTNRSRMNQETWEFAHQDFGKRWYRGGWGLLMVTILLMCLAPKGHVDQVGGIGGLLTIGQVAVMLAPICMTEKALAKRFDKQGNRREKD